MSFSYLCILETNSACSIVEAEILRTKHHHYHIFGNLCTEPGLHTPDPWICGGQQIQGSHPNAAACADPQEINIIYSSTNDVAEERDVIAFPRGTGMRVGGDTGLKYIVVWVHLPEIGNLTDGLTPWSQMKFKLISESGEKTLTEAGFLLMSVLGSILPLSNGCVTGSYVIKERIQAVNAVGVFPHTHNYGTRFQVWLVKKESKRIPLFDMKTFGRETLYPIESTPVSTGDKFVVRCSYRNTLNERLLVS